MTAFLLTWKASGWPYENILRMVQTIAKDGYVDEPWRIAAHRMAKAGDRVWVLRQGPGPKGIFGAGYITDKPQLDHAGNGKARMLAPVRFEAFADPTERMIIGEKAVAKILRPTQIRSAASGYPLRDDQNAAFEALLSKAGDWTGGELHAIVADYFAMLDKELKGKRYSKTEHRNALRQHVQRSSGAIERKHQNISAVLLELGLPWIRGYKPLRTFQDALVNVIDARLGQGVEHLDQIAPSSPTASAANLSTIFVRPPRSARPLPKGRAIRRVIRKFDLAARDEANRRLGRAGEQFVLELEHRRLKKLGRRDLAEKIRWVSQSIGDGIGYDIESFADDGNPIFIEVKTTRGCIDTPFYLSENERCTAAEKGAAFRL